jgi:hypothetical protein
MNLTRQLPALPTADAGLDAPIPCSESPRSAAPKIADACNGEDWPPADANAPSATRHWPSLERRGVGRVGMGRRRESRGGLTRLNDGANRDSVTKGPTDVKHDDRRIEL